MVTDIAEQQAGVGLVQDQPQIAAHAHGSEVGVASPLELVQLQAGLGRIHLQVKGRGLYRLLFLIRQPGKAVDECIRDTELHQSTLNTFMTSSPR